MSADNTPFNIDNFDQLFTGNPVDIENSLSALLPRAYKRDNKSTYIQILTQIALAQAMQEKFDLAHQTLDQAEEALKPEYKLGKIRLLLERGRVHHQSGDKRKALSLFNQSYAEAQPHPKFDFHTTNAAHMIAIVTPKVEDKIKWNQIAIDVANNTTDTRCKSWLGALYTNLARSYLEGKQYANALKSFQKSKSFADQHNHTLISLGASWGIGKALRLLESYNKALSLQQSLLEEYSTPAVKNALPTALIQANRGMVHEELAELYHALNNKPLSKTHASLALGDLNQNSWMKKEHPKRLQRLQNLKNPSLQ